MLNDTNLMKLTLGKKTVAFGLCHMYSTVSGNSGLQCAWGIFIFQGEVLGSSSKHALSPTCNDLTRQAGNYIARSHTITPKMALGNYTIPLTV